MQTRTVHIAIGVVLAGTFLIDSLTPLGHQEFILYVLPIILTIWLEQAWSAYVMAGAATVLVYTGLLLSPAGIPMEVALLNRTLSAALFWVVAALVIRSRGAILDRGSRQLAALVNSSADAIISQDLSGTVMTWNASAERMFGYTAADMIGRSMHVLIPSDWIQQEIDRQVGVGGGEAVAQYETVWRHRDGRLVELSLSLSPILNQAGEVVGISTIGHDIAQLKATMRLLREHEVRLDLVVSATKTGIWDWDLKTNRRYYSPLWKESLGYRPDELSDSQDEWITRLHPDDRDRAFALVKQFLEGAIPTYHLEHRLRHRDGAYRWISTQALLMRDAQGVPIRMTGSHVDIAEQKQAEQALRHSEERFRKYFEMGLIGMALTAPDKRWISVNDRLCQMLGYSRDELLQASWPSLTHPDDIEKNIDVFQQALRGQINGYQLEKRFIHKDGHLVYAVLSCCAIRKDDGAFDYFVVLVHDITDQRRAEVSLRESEVTLQSFFSSAALMMGVVKVLPDDVVHLSDNQATADFFGTTIEAMRGRRASQFATPRDILDLWVKRYHRCIAMRAPVRFEYEHEVVRGGMPDRRVLAATVSLIGNGSDGQVRCAYVAEDITERRQAETLLRQAHESLERRVEERTSELVQATQRARVLAQRLYEVQEAERRQLAQDLHDEIGQALTALRLNLQQVEQESAGSVAGVELQESIDISDQLLARVRSLALDLRPSLLDDLGLVPALRWYATRQAERMGWALHLDLPDGLPDLPGPRTIACFRVVQESLTNVARHAMAKMVSVSLTVQGNLIRVAVHDDGCGFDTEAMRVSAQQGRSMGLLGMEERISLVGGTLSVESAAGEGTTVFFSIPVAESQQEPFIK